MRLVLLGAPGVGKGTQAEKLVLMFGIPHISTGDIFRSNIKNGTQLGLKVREYLDKGALVPDSLTMEIVEDRLRQQDCAKGFVLDGFPRTIPQAVFLDETLAAADKCIDTVINIGGADEDIIRRLSGRRICKSCSANYHIKSKPPAVEGVCDECGGALVQRDDDKEDTIRNRLDVYRKQTEPLVRYYQDKGILDTVNGMTSIDGTYNEIVDVFKKKGLI